MITHTISPTHDGNFRAEVVFMFGNRKNRLPRFCSDLNRASQEVNRLKKRILIDELQKFVNHRKVIINRFGGQASVRRFKALDRMQQIIDISKGERCLLVRFALRLSQAADDLSCLIPGPSSRYHDNQQCLVSEILSDCKSILNEYSHESIAS